uniref:Calmegin n=1 Tax=Mastacembelus armatus TaxID=205130 RepID=A0A7N8X2J3_9TELE
MKLDRGWLWCVLLLSSLAVALVTAEDKELDADVSDDEEMEKGMSEILKFYSQVTYKTPVPTGDVYFAETFDDGTLGRWQLSKTVKGDADDDIAKYDGKWAVEQLKENKVPGDKGLVLKSRAKHHAIAAMLNKPFVFQDEPLVIQYEVNFQDGIDCGGAYIKLLSDTGSLNLEQFHDRTPYTIMFGPDKCGEDYKLHLIFRHQNPLNKDMEEKHAKRADVDLKKFYTDKKTHLYTLVLNPDNTYEMFIDQSSVSRGNLLHDVVPPVNPPKEIDDPHDSKPEDWDERAKIPDPEAVKPDAWDEDAPAKIEDPDAMKPEGWLDDEPEFIDNPEYFEDLQPFRMTPFKALGLELWSMTSDIYFDNFIITSHKEVADRWASDSWGLKKLVASANEPGIFAQLMMAAEERPWLWVIYILTVGLPLGLAVLFCWPKKSENDYVHKKVDVPQANEEEDEEEEEEEPAAADEEDKAAEATEGAPVAGYTVLSSVLNYYCYFVVVFLIPHHRYAYSLNSNRRS